MFSICSNLLFFRFSCEETTMGVQIEAMDGGRLKVTGDVESLLNLPGRAVTDGFSFAFSAGTLIRGHHAIATGRCHLARSEEHTSELQSLMRSSYAVSCLKKKPAQQTQYSTHQQTATVQQT